MVEIKLCKNCNKPIEEENLHINYCIKCKTNIDKNNKLQSERLLQKAYNLAKENIEKYTIDNGKTLTPIGFNEVSPISYRKLTQSLRGNTWVDILKMFGKYDNLQEYIKEEYKKYILLNNNPNFTHFVKTHNYINPMFIKGFNQRELYDYIGINYNKNNEYDYRTNFMNIKSELGYIPLCSEFRKFTKITGSNYALHFYLKGIVYDKIVKMYSTEDEFIEYKNRQKEHKSKIGKLTCNMNKELVTKEQLEIELKNIFDNFYAEYNKYPAIRIFEKISKRDKRTFEEKFGKKFKDLCLDYGYDIEDKASAEYIFLTKISKLLGEKCDRQKTWKWLRGVNDFPLWVDGYYKKHNLAIEFDGIQHQQPVKKFGGEKTFITQQANDNVKNILIPEHGIKLIRVSSFEDWFNEDYLKEVLVNHGIIK